MILASGVCVFAQQTPEVPPVPSPTIPKKVEYKAPVAVVAAPRGTVERSIAVDKKPTISMCVASGVVRVTGWDRDEVRALVDGGDFTFKVAERSAKGDQPSWIFIIGDPRAKGAVKPDECLSGDLIEIDVPRDASINIKGSPDETRINSVSKVKIETISGSIFARNVASGVSASTFEGAIIVERSKGPMMLASTSGAIVAFDLGQAETGDVFKAKTQGGTITLQSVTHRQVEVNTISGAVVYRGTLLGGGLYSFGSQNGRVTLNLPVTTGCKFNAWYGVGYFNTEIAAPNMVKSGPSATGQLGKTETGCTLTLKTTSGTLRIAADANSK
jgi:hypothetical protein